MSDGKHTLLILDGGSSLVSSARGDQYWIVDQQGVSTPCPLEEVCRLWLWYEASLEPGFEASRGAASGPGQGAPPRPPPEPAKEELASKTYSDWQLEICNRLGLSPEDLEHADELEAT
ncbi:MAG: hypothetical protein RBU30_08685 [Polyangia bacterium]|jgi:hypothetical protein|nr:hypothetical protein [Polyangia bacterium]